MLEVVVSEIRIRCWKQGDDSYAIVIKVAPTWPILNPCTLINTRDIDLGGWTDRGQET